MFNRVPALSFAASTAAVEDLAGAPETTRFVPSPPVKGVGRPGPGWTSYNSENLFSAEPRAVTESPGRPVASYGRAPVTQPPYTQVTPPASSGPQQRRSWDGEFCPNPKCGNTISGDGTATSDNAGVVRYLIQPMRSRTQRLQPYRRRLSQPGEWNNSLRCF